MADYTANFNTKIYSSKNVGSVLYYTLNDVITTNIKAPNYELNGQPEGVYLSQEIIKGKTVLVIPDNITFDLIVSVSDRGGAKTMASTTVTIATTNTFQEEVNNFSKNQTVIDSLTNLKSNWDAVIG